MLIKIENHPLDKVRERFSDDTIAILLSNKRNQYSENATTYCMGLYFIITIMYVCLVEYSITKLTIFLDAPFIFTILVVIFIIFICYYGHKSRKQNNFLKDFLSGKIVLAPKKRRDKNV